jgi:hypothetical protein
VQTGNGYEPLDLAKTYTVATNAFTADGGDGYGMFKEAKNQGRINELLIVDYEILVEYLEKHSPVSPKVEGRILAGEEQQPEPPKTIEGVMADLDGLMTEYAANGELSGPLKSQLENSYKQAKHHYSKGSAQNALKFLNKYLDQLDHKTKQNHVTDQAKQNLEDNVQSLIELLQA